MKYRKFSFHNFSHFFFSYGISLPLPSFSLSLSLSDARNMVEIYGRVSKSILMIVLFSVVQWFLVLF